MADVTPGTVQDGFRFVGGDAASPSSWEPVDLKIGTIQDGFQFLGGDPATPDSWAKVEPAPEPTKLDRAKDAGVSLMRGGVGAVEGVVGLADLASGGAAGKAVQDDLRIDLKGAKDYWGEKYSEAQKAANKNVAEADGIGGVLKAVWDNPSVVPHTVLESLPGMVAGGLVGRGVLAAAPKLSGAVAAGIGEGTFMAGSAAEQIRQQTKDGLLTGEQAALAGATGVAGGVIGVFGAKLAQRLGLADVDVMLTGAAANPRAAKGITRMTIEGAIAEGFLEELPQSVVEQVLQNQALGRPLDEGVDHAAVLGTLAGGTMGGGANLYHGMTRAPAPPPPAPTAAPAVNPQAAAAAVMSAPDVDTAIQTANDALAAALASTVAPGQTLTGTDPATLLQRPDSFMDSVREPRSFTGNSASDLLASQPTDPLLGPAREGAIAREDQHQDDLAGQAEQRMRREVDAEAQGLREWPAKTLPRKQPTEKPLDLVIQPDDIIQKNGAPWPSEAAARLTIKTRELDAALVPTEGGFIIRPNKPATTENSAAVQPSAQAPATAGPTTQNSAAVQPIPTAKGAPDATQPDSLGSANPVPEAVPAGRPAAGGAVGGERPVGEAGAVRPGSGNAAGSGAAARPTRADGLRGGDPAPGPAQNPVAQASRVESAGPVVGTAGTSAAPASGNGPEQRPGLSGLAASDTGASAPVPASAAPVNESDQDRSNRQWRENYARVSGAEDLNAISEADIEKAINFASMQVARLGPGKAWEGDEQAKKLIEAYNREIESLEFHVRNRPGTRRNTKAPAPAPAAPDVPGAGTAPEADAAGAVPANDAGRSADANPPLTADVAARWDAMSEYDRLALVSQTAAKGKAQQRVIAKKWDELEPGWQKSIARVAKTYGPTESEKKASPGKVAPTDIAKVTDELPGTQGTDQQARVEAATATGGDAPGAAPAGADARAGALEAAGVAEQPRNAETGQFVEAKAPTLLEDAQHRYDVADEGGKAIIQPALDILKAEQAAPAKRGAKKADPARKLRLDYGVDGIDGYTTTDEFPAGPGGDEPSGGVKDAFLRDAANYLREVATALQERGFTPHVDSKGRPEKPVSTNRSGVAGSGEVSLTLAGPQGVGIYLQIGANMGREPEILMRTATDKDRYGKGMNLYPKNGLTAQALADHIEQTVGKEAPAATAPSAAPTGPRVVVNMLGKDGLTDAERAAGKKPYTDAPSAAPAPAPAVSATFPGPITAEGIALELSSVAGNTDDATMLLVQMSREDLVPTPERYATLMEQARANAAKVQAQFDKDMEAQKPGEVKAAMDNLAKYAAYPPRVEQILGKLRAIGGSQTRLADRILEGLKTAWDLGEFRHAAEALVEFSTSPTKRQRMFTPGGDPNWSAVVGSFLPHGGKPSLFSVGEARAAAILAAMKPAAPTPAATIKPSANKIFTEEKANAARARLLAKRGTLNSGLDPEAMFDGIMLAGYHIEKGARTFAAYAKAMLAELGDEYRPHLKSWYMGVKYSPDAAEFSGQMSSAAFVEEFDVSAIAAPSDTAPVESQPPITDTGDSNGTTTRNLDSAGPGSLEGAPADDVRAADASRDAGAGVGGSGNGDQRGNPDADAPGGELAGSVGADPGAVPVSAAGGRGRGANAKKPRLPRAPRPDAGSGLFDDAGREGVSAPNAAPTPAPQFKLEDFTIEDDLALGEGGQKTKFRNNVAAIRLLRELEASERHATPDEQKVLAQYVGWGGLPQAFDAANADWAREHAELSALLDDKEFAAARQSTRYAHYTSKQIIQDGVYAAMRRFGFTGGRVLEGGAGVGNFIGMMPQDLRSAGRVTAVEREPIAAGIARNLYPNQSVQLVDFTEFKGTDGYYDAAVGNPPFASDPQTDRSGRKHLNGLSLHNYFFAKEVDMLREGGILAQVVTNSFMDAAGDRARKYISDRTKLLGAIRLPNNAFSKNAGTEVTTDIIFLQKRPEAQWGNKQTRLEAKAWLDVVKMRDARKGVEINVNQYFADHPEMMLGDFGAHGTMYGPNQPALIARPGQDTLALLREAVARLPAGVYVDRAVQGTDEAIDGAVQALTHPTVQEGGYFLEGDTLMQRLPDIAGEARGKEITAATQWTAKTTLGDTGLAKIRALAGMRVTLRALLAAELSGDAAMTALRTELGQAYDAYVKEHGLLNDPATARVFDDDPDFPLLLSLEHNYTPGIGLAAAKRMGLKPTKSTAKKAPIFSQRVVDARRAVQKVETPADALAVSMAERGKLDTAYIGQLLGQNPDDVLRELSTGDKPQLFLDPATDEYVLRDAYLSGNVRAKLTQARQAGLGSNARALEAVIPEDVGAHEIVARIGSPWVPTAVYEDFARELFGEGTAATVKYVKLASSYSVYVRAANDLNATSKWGTPAYRGPELLAALLNNRPIKVTYKDSEGKQVTDGPATEMANTKAQEIRDRFQDWLFAEAARSDLLVRAYNDTNNNYVTREYDGTWMTFPGKVPDSVIKFRRHQRNAIARIVQDRTTLLDHVVGAGKTFTVVAGAMELRRTGLAKKPMVAVPNHLVKQWAADFYRLYPGANILTATKKDFEKINRRRFLAKIATGDWDAVVIAHSSFGFIKPGAEFEAAFNEKQVKLIMDTIKEVKEGEGDDKAKKRTVKQLEGMKERLENRIRSLRDKAMDDLLDFEQLGVDQLFVDEAHMFKNLMFSTKMQGVQGLGDSKGSQRAYDMYVKSQEVLAKNGRGQGLVFATGTPVSNSLAEKYHMMRYLMPQQMEDLGFQSFDAWANTFASVEQVWMQKPSGDGFKASNRMSNFVNVHELLKMFDQVADTVTMDDIKKAYREENEGKEFPIPPLKTGRRQPVSLEKSAAQNAYMDEIAQRARVLEARKGPPQKGEDNTLVIMGDARKAAMDIRLVDMNLTEREKGGRIDRSADEILTRYTQFAHVKGTQLVFSDLGTPKKHAQGELKEYNALQERIERASEEVRSRAAFGAEDAQDLVDDAEDAQAALDAMGPDWLTAVKAALRGFSVYDDLKDALIERGIPAEQIAFIHDYNTDEQKAGLFRKVNAGDIRVVMGSTAKMGAGTNVQERLVALHHLDVPWRPSDVEQREGRIERQGNALLEQIPGFEVEILAYVTRDTLDMRMWQIQEVKLKMINQLRTRKIDRNIDNAFEDMEMSAGEMQAAATGNMDLLREIQARADIKKLEQKRRSFDAQKSDLINRKKSAAAKLARLPRQIEDAEVLAEGAALYDQALREQADAFTVSIDGKDYTDRQAASQYLLGLIDAKIYVRTYEKDGKKLREEISPEQWAALPDGDARAFYDPKAAPIDVQMNGVQYTARAKLKEAWSGVSGDRDPIQWSYNGEQFNRRTALATAIEKTVADAIADEQLVELGQVGPFAVTAEGQPLKGGGKLLDVVLSYKGKKISGEIGVPEGDATLKVAEQIATWADRKAAGAAGELSWLKSDLASAQKAQAELDKADALGDEWPEQAKLEAARAAHKEILARLSAVQAVETVMDAEGTTMTVLEKPTEDAGSVRVRFADGTEGYMLATQLMKLDGSPAFDGAPMFSQAAFDQDSARPVAATPKKVGTLQAALDAITENWAKAPPVTVVSSVNSPSVPLPVRLASAKAVRNGGGQARGVFYRGQVWIFADMVSRPEQALEVLLHEVIGHFGLRLTFGEDFAHILDQVVKLRRKEVDAMVRRTGMDPSDPATLRRAAEETLAYLSQTQPTLGVVRRAVAAIRAWLRDTFPSVFEKLALTDDEIIARFILPARRTVLGRDGVVSAPESSDGDAVAVQGGRDGALGDAKALSGILQGSAFRQEGLRALEVPEKRVVLDAVRSALHDLQIARRVIQLVPVDVMHNLAAKQGTPEALLHDKAVLENIGAVIKGEHAVAGRGDATRALVLAVAFERAKQQGAAGKGALAFALDPAVRTFKSDLAAAMQADAGARAEQLGALGDVVGFALESSTAVGADKIQDRQGVTPTSDVELGNEGVDASSNPSSLDDEAQFSQGMRTIQVDGIRRPDSNSKGQPIYPMTHGIQGMLNFWRWFKASPFTDDKGRPLVIVRSAAIDSLLTGEPARAEAGMDGLRGNAELLAHLLQSSTFREKGLGGLDAPAQRVVIAAVRAFGHDLKVLRGVVDLVPVPVVDYLARNQLTPKDLFRNEAVLKKLLSFDGDSNVAVGVDVANALVRAVTGVSAEGAATGRMPVGLGEGDAASGADVGYLAVSHSDPTVLEFKSTGNNGQFDPLGGPMFSQAGATDDDTGPVSASGKAASQLLASMTVTNLKKQAGYTFTDYRGLGLGALGRRQITELFAKDLPELDRYNRLVQQMDADKNEEGAAADGVARDWAKLPDERQLAELMHDATLAKIDPAKDFLDGDSRPEYDRLRRKWDALTPEAQATYTRARDMYEEHLARVREAIRERIERAEISSERRAELLARMDGDFFDRVQGVYFPLARFGKYVIIAKDAAGNTLSVSRAETMAEAEATRELMRKGMPEATVGKVILAAEFNASRDAVGRGFLKGLFDVLDQQGVSPELQDAVNQLYLSSLPDLSWAKAGIHRKGTPGFSQDARRAYAQRMFHGARYLAKLRYADQLQASLDAMEKTVREGENVDGYDAVKARQVVDEMVKRHDLLMNPQSSALSTALTSIGFIFHLGLSPASAAVNLTQTGLVTYPMMGAKWGFAKAGQALLAAGRETAVAKNDLRGTLKGDELAAYDQAVKSGMIDVTMAHDLAGIAQGEDQGVMWRMRPVMRAASFLFHHAERFNRQATFLAAYRLARQGGANADAAYEQASEITYASHFDLSASNRPRLMQGNVARVVLLFKSFAQNMVYILSRQAYLSMKGLTPEERSQARKTLAGLLVMHAAGAGVLGLPLVGTLLAAASFLGGGDDEPWDAEVALRNLLAETLGKKPAEVLSRGLSRLTPSDISGRVGLDKLIIPDIQEGLEGTRLAEAMMAAALGPVAGIGVNVARGAQKMGEGQWARGLEDMLPSALRGPLKAVRYAQEGAIDKTGIPIKDEVGTLAVLGQALGFSPSEVREATEGKSAVRALETRLSERRRNLLQMYSKSVVLGDSDGAADARADILAFNAKNPEYRIKPESMMKSVTNRRRRIAEAEDGIYLPKKHKSVRDAGRFASED